MERLPLFPVVAASYSKQCRGLMPIFKYFVLVGGFLLALLLAADRYLPRPTERTSAVIIDRSIIRIHSAQVGPEKIDFDTASPARQLPANQAEQRDDGPRERPAMMTEAGARGQMSAAPAAQEGDRTRRPHANRKASRQTERRLALDHLPASAW